MRRSQKRSTPLAFPCLPLTTPGTKTPLRAPRHVLKERRAPARRARTTPEKGETAAETPARRTAQRTQHNAQCGAHQPRHKSTKAEQGPRNAGSRRQRHGIRQKRKRPPQGAFSGWSSYVGKRPCMRPSKAPCAPKKEGAAPHRLSDRAVNKSGKRRTPQKSKRAPL